VHPAMGCMSGAQSIPPPGKPGCLPHPLHGQCQLDCTVLQAAHPLRCQRSSGACQNCCRSTFILAISPNTPYLSTPSPPTPPSSPTYLGVTVELWEGLIRGGGRQCGNTGRVLPRSPPPPHHRLQQRAGQAPGGRNAGAHLAQRLIADVVGAAGGGRGAGGVVGQLDTTQHRGGRRQRLLCPSSSSSPSSPAAEGVGDVQLPLPLYGPVLAHPQVPPPGGITDSVTSRPNSRVLPVAAHCSRRGAAAVCGRLVGVQLQQAKAD
jgi:hypothetical protein